MLLNQNILKRTCILLTKHCAIRSLGSGAGKDGKNRFTRSAGGKLDEPGAAREDEYFHRKQKEQLSELKKKRKKEIFFQVRKKKNETEEID